MYRYNGKGNYKLYLTLDGGCVYILLIAACVQRLCLLKGNIIARMGTTGWYCPHC